MKKHLPKTIQFRIFISTSSMILIIIIASMLLYYFTMSRNFAEQYTASSVQLTKIISGRLDQTIETTNSLQKRILESDTVRVYALEDLPSINHNDIYLRQREFEQAIFGIAGYDYGFYHMNIITLEGWLISFGQEYNFKQIDFDASLNDWMNPILDKNGSPYIASFITPKLGEKRPSISLCRAFSRYPLNEPKAIIEIQIDLQSLEKEIDNILASYDNLSNRVLVFNDRMEPIYPLELTTSEVDHYAQQSVSGKNKNPFTNEVEVISVHDSAYTGWTTVITTPYSEIIKGTKQYMILTILIGLLGSATMLFIAFSIARSISAPIIAVRDSLVHLRLENLGQSEPMVFQSDYNELELLGKAVTVMEKRMKRSLDDYVHMRSLSIQARMMALQSQMNPHFLYNTLSIISILAEENGDMQVSQMCLHLVEMLRYGVRESKQTTLKREIEHARHYIELMTIRFGDKINFTLEQTDGLDLVECPPMILQPLIENSVKYAHSDDHLDIRIICAAQAGKWSMTVKDNGLGFSKEALEVFQNQIQGSDSVEDIIARGITGIGLANIYMRLRLSYGDEMLFIVENTAEGAIVTVGGTASIINKEGNAANESEQ